MDLIAQYDRDTSFDVEAILPMSLSNNVHLAHGLPNRSITKLPDWIPRGILYAPWWIRGTRLNLQADLIHRTYFSRRFLDTSKKTPQIITVYDMIPELFGGTSSFTAAHLQKREYVATCDLVICISESTRQDLVNVYGDLPNATEVIPLAVDASFRPGLPPLANLPSEYLLYVGKRDGYKDFSLLPAALRQLPKIDIPLAVVGPPLSKHERDYLADLGLVSSVHFLNLHDSDLRRAYANATATVQTSRYEGFGLVALESLASGTPTVVARSSSMPEVVGEDACFFEPGDSESLAQALERVLTDNQLARDLSLRGPERAKLFTPRQMAKQTADAYRRVVA